MNAKPLLILVALFSLLPTVPSQARDPDPPGGPMALPLLLRKLDRNFRVLYVTAHPDDEDAALLSWLAWGQGVDVTLLTLTHGEGGQNEIGPELGPDLAQLRVWELMAAARYHGAQQAFEDFADFGYSFSVEETLERWGEATAIERIAQRIRLLRPDVVITMEPFGEGGGQHHQASAKLTARAVERVNSEVEANDDANWLGVRRVFARLWQATPDLPICTVDTGAYDPLLGKSHFENGVVARGMHKCQGMVRDHAPFSAEPSRLALLLNRHSRVDAPSQPFDGLDETGLEWEGQATEAGLHLREAAQSLRDAWRPEGVDLVPGLLALERWRVTGGGHVSTDLLRKIDAALLLASGLRLEVRGEPVIMTSTDPLMLYAHNAGPYTLTLSLEREDGNRHRRQPPLVLKPGARLVKEVRVPAAPFFAMEVAIGDLGSFGLQRYAEWADIDVRGLLPRRGPCWPFDVSETRLGLPRQPIVLPGFRPADLVIPFVGEKAPEVAIDGPFGLASSVTDDELSVRIEANEERAGSGRLRFSAKCVDRRAIDYPHISLAYTGVRNPQLEIKSFPCEVDRSRRVGYLGGTGDFVPEALERLGVTTQMLDDDALRAGAFANLDTLILGVRAYKLRPALAEMHAALMEWVEKGGVLIVQYQKLEMNAGQGASPYGPFPGLRVGHGRVTDETAPIRKLVPDHPVFQQPNLLTDADWEGWVQERGLYFLELSDPRYVDLVETEDPFPFNAGPKRGALVEARHGKGRWCYVGLGLFRQLRAGVPGAWRLLANLVSLTSSSP